MSPRRLWKHPMTGAERSPVLHTSYWQPSRQLICNPKKIERHVTRDLWHHVPGTVNHGSALLSDVVSRVERNGEGVAPVEAVSATNSRRRRKMSKTCRGLCTGFIAQAPSASLQHRYYLAVSKPPFCMQHQRPPANQIPASLIRKKNKAELDAKLRMCWAEK